MSEAEFRFLSVEDVLELHAMQLESYGGATGIRAPDLIESAVMTPQASFHFLSPPISLKNITPTWTLLGHQKFHCVLSSSYGGDGASTIFGTKFGA